jgi:hypothetical protein
MKNIRNHFDSSFGLPPNTVYQYSPIIRWFKKVVGNLANIAFEYQGLLKIKYPDKKSSSVTNIKKAAHTCLICAAFIK